jgi:hypothetical protein
MAIKFQDGWNDESGHFSNHDSSLSETEMESLVGEILQIDKMDNLPDDAHQCWKDLATGLKSGDITVVKGIHQRNTKVHFNVASSAAPNVTYHIFVKAGQSKLVYWQKRKTTLKSFSCFSHTVSGFSCKVAGVMQLYPAVYATLDEIEKPGRPRRESFSIGNIARENPNDGKMVVLDV